MASGLGIEKMTLIRLYTQLVEIGKGISDFCICFVCYVMKWQ
jgi:hypothetical protein